MQISRICNSSCLYLHCFCRMKTLKIYKLENGAKRASNMPESFQNKKMERTIGIHSAKG